MRYTREDEAFHGGNGKPDGAVKEFGATGKVQLEQSGFQSLP